MSETTDETNTVTIKIKVLGSEDIHELTVPLNTTILALKEKVAEFSKFPLESIRLIFGGRSLQNGETLSTYKIEDGHTIIVHCSRSGQKSNRVAEDPPPPPNNLNPPPPPSSDNQANANQQSDPPFQQSPVLPPLPHNSVTDFKRDLSVIQLNIALLLESATHLQSCLSRTNAAEINESIQKYTNDCQQVLQDTFNKVQSIQHTNFVTNNSRVEVNEEHNNTNTTNNTNTNTNNSLNNNTPNPTRNTNTGSSTNQNGSNTNQNTQPQTRPVVDDIFTPNDRAFIQQQISNLDDYVDNNELDESYSSTNIYRQLN